MKLTEWCASMILIEEKKSVRGEGNSSMYVRNGRSIGIQNS